jgi:hypothetical protein
MSRGSILGFVAAVIALAGGSAAAAEEKKPEPLVMKMSGYIAPVNTDVIVRLRVEPDARSREVNIEWVGDDLSGGAHAIALDGARAAATHQYSIRHMSPGRYVVTATLRLNDGTEVKRNADVVVIGLGGPDLASGDGAALGGRVGPASRR